MLIDKEKKILNNSSFFLISRKDPGDIQASICT